MKPTRLFRRVSQFTFGTCAIAGSALASPGLFDEGIIFDSLGNSVLRDNQTLTPVVRDNVEFFTQNGGILLWSAADATSSSAFDGGITLWGNPLNVVLQSQGMYTDQATFAIWKGDTWGQTGSQPFFKVDAATGASTFNGTVSINNSPALTYSSAISQNFLQLNSGVLTIPSTATNAINTTGGISISKESTIGGLKIGTGGGAMSSNVAIGTSTLSVNSTGNTNTAVGERALFLNTTGAANTALGASSLRSNTSGSSNTSVGSASLYNNLTGIANVAVGTSALRFKSYGSANTAIGTNAGTYSADGSTQLTTSNNSTYIGSNTTSSSGSVSNEVVIGANASGAGSNTTVIGNSITTHTYLKGETNSASLRVTGATVLEGDVVLAEAQGDISMGDYQ